MNIRLKLRHMYRKVIVASDSFKGSLSSLDVASGVEKAVHEVYPSCEVIKVNVADGGEGTMDALRETLGGRKMTITVSDPLFRPIEASYVILDDGITAVLEMSASSGLPLLTAQERNPSKTSTLGTGELIRDALDKGCRRFLVGIGGSATNDAGMGMLHALGYRFKDAAGHDLLPVGGSLGMVDSFDDSGIHPALTESVFIVACDVKAPLYGPEGAAYVFAPQKGADEQMVKELDGGLKHFASVAKQIMGYDYSMDEGSGAAGGLGYAFRQFFEADLEKGVEMVLDAVHFDDIIKGADLVVTGEGRIDGQTLTGKTPFGVARRAIRQRIPVVAIGGSVAISPTDAESAGFDKVLRITPQDMPLEEAMKPEVASDNVYKTIKRFLSL